MFSHTNLSLLIRRKVKTCVLTELIIRDHLRLIRVVIRFASAQLHLDNIVQKAQLKVKPLFCDLLLCKGHVEQDCILDSALPQRLVIESSLLDFEHL